MIKSLYGSRSGFTIMAALGLCVLLGILSMGVLLMQKSIENETFATSVRHSKALAEDILKSQIAIQAKRINTRVEIETFVRSFAPDSRPNSGFRLEIPGTNCNGVPCILKLLPSNPNDPSSPLIPNMVNQASIVLRLGVDPAQSAHMKYKLEPILIKIYLPSQAEIDAQKNAATGNFICGAAKPIFKGTKPGPGRTLVADCAAIDAGTSARVTPTNGGIQVACNVASGLWMREISDSLAPHCVNFPDTPRSPASIEVCPVGKVAKYYELNNRFVLNPVCVDKGKPYDFMREN